MLATVMSGAHWRLFTLSKDIDNPAPSSSLYTPCSRNHPVVLLAARSLRTLENGRARGNRDDAQERQGQEQLLR